MSTPGIYSVSLVAMNLYGADIETKTNYITVSSIKGSASRMGVSGHRTTLFS